METQKQMRIYGGMDINALLANQIAVGFRKRRTSLKQPRTPVSHDLQAPVVAVAAIETAEVVTDGVVAETSVAAIPPQEAVVGRGMRAIIAQKLRPPTL